MVGVKFTYDSAGTPRSVWTEHPGWRATALDLSDSSRVVVLAAHPDDESLGAAGLLATAAGRGAQVDLLLATAGEGSHPESLTHPPDRLAAIRVAESRAALALVAAEGRTTCLRVSDGRVADAENQLVQELVQLIDDGRSTLLLSPWRYDGHPDHEACGRAAAVAARRTGARLLQFPIWFWHWGTPATMPWSRVRQLSLPPAVVSAKRAAINAHATQLRPLSPASGDEQLLREDFLAHFAGPIETFLEEDPRDEALDDLHRRDSDPWETESSWYEQRKRALTLAVLPRPDYERGLEVGCSTGVLAAELTERCRSLVAADASPAAVAAATARIGSTPGVSVEHLDLPRQWPSGTFDLVVVSEVGYFLSPRDLDALVARVDAALSPGGDVVLCHWRHTVVGWPLNGPAVHDRFRSLLRRAEVATYRDRDFELSVFSAAPLTEARV